MQRTDCKKVFQKIFFYLTKAARKRKYQKNEHITQSKKVITTQSKIFLNTIHNKISCVFTIKLN